jgi:hypothetical protein
MSAGCEMRRIEYLLRLSVLVGRRSPPRLSTPVRPSKKRMTCFVLIFNRCATSAGVKYSANEGEILTSELGASGCCRARILACARSSRVAFNQSRFPGWSDLSSNDQCSSLWAHRTTTGVKFADVALPDAQRNRSPDGSSCVPLALLLGNRKTNKSHWDRVRALNPWPDRTARRHSCE